MSDGFLTLAQAPGGLTCFLVPRWLDGARNGIHLMRLKDKLGNRSNASAEIEYHDALAWRLGDEGQGVRTIIEMVHHTRLDTAMAPAGLMRAALVEAVWWARHRSVFQRRLADQPLMAAVLADLALDAEGALALGLRTARAFDGSGPSDRGFARIAVALAKFLSNHLAPGLIFEAMEALGGIGYVEEAPLAMLYREAPLNAIWEGSGNVICLDILRTLARDPEAAAALMAELAGAKGLHPAYDAALADLPAAPTETRRPRLCRTRRDAADRRRAFRRRAGRDRRGLCREPPRPARPALRHRAAICRSRRSSSVLAADRAGSGRARGPVKGPSPARVGPCPPGALPPGLRPPPGIFSKAKTEHPARTRRTGCRFALRSSAFPPVPRLQYPATGLTGPYLFAF